jgi:transposase-like protein
MQKRRWDPKTKAMIVLQGLKGKPIAQLCAEHQISQAQYYLWRDQFLANMHRTFVSDDRREKVLTRENVHLKKIIGDLTVELKKIEEGQG